MLAVIAIILVGAYLVLDRSGILADLSARARGPRGGGPPPQPALHGKTRQDPDVDRRLEVFEDFIARLEATDEDDEES